LVQSHNYFGCGGACSGTFERLIGRLRAAIPELSLRRGTQFVVGFFPYDRRAHLQIDGKAVTLGKRIALSGSRYSGGGVTLKITKAGTTVKHGKRPATACEQT
jgi:hypothetical protein